MALRKPSEYFKKDIATVNNSVKELPKTPELNTFSNAFESFKSNLSKIEVLSEFTETLDNYRLNVERVNHLSEKVEDIQDEIQNLLKKEDLDRAMMSQLLVVEQSIRDVQNKVKGINEKNLTEIRSDVSDLTESVNQFLQIDVPKYKKLIVDSELRIRNFIQDDLNNNEETRNDLKKKVTDLEVNIIRNESHIRTQNKNLEQIQENVKSAIQKLNLEELERQNHKLGKKIKYLEDVFEKFSEKEILTESIVVEPPSTKNEDPLTPLDQNFVTLDQLQQHYRLFINRIQQQLSTLGGGGETQLKYLDDIVGIATNAAAYDDKFLKYNHSIGKFEFVTVSGGSGGADIIIQDEGTIIGTAATTINFVGSGVSASYSSGITTVTITGGAVDLENVSTNSVTIVENSVPITLQKAFTTTTSTTDPTSIHKSLLVSDYSTVEYTIQAAKGLDIETKKIVCVNDTTNINNTEVYSVSVGSTFTSYDINIVDGYIDLVVTPTDLATINYSISYTAISRPESVVQIDYLISTENDELILTEDGNMIQIEVS